MDNDFERQFRQSVKVVPDATILPTPAPAPAPAPAPTPAPIEPVPTKNRYKLLFFIFVALTIIETIVLVFLLVAVFNQDTEPAYLSFDDESIKYDDEAETGPSDEDTKYVFDNDGNLTSFNLTCTNGDTSYIFSKYNTYQNGDDEGEYSINRSFIISMSSFSDSEYTLYYDGFVLADGNTIYECS